jgi:surface protein
MANPIKYSTGSETKALKKGNFFIGTGDVGKGPSDVTGYYQGVDVPQPGYVVYQYLESSASNLTYATLNSDAELINFTNGIADESFTSVAQCFTYYATQNDKVCFNRDYEPIVTDGLVLNVDAGFDGSYPASGTTWRDLSVSGNNGTLINSPGFYDNGGGSIVFDGTDDYINIPSTSGPSQQTIEIFFKANNISSKTLLVGNPVYRPRISLRNNVITVYYGMETGTGDINFTFNSILVSQYYQLVYTYSGGTNHKCYLNTVEGTRTFNGSALSGTPNFTSISLGISAGSESFFNGQIFSFRLYNRVLSDGEILQNYNAMKDRFAFIFTVDTTKVGTTSSTQFKLPLVSSGSVNFVVEWGDGTTDTITTFNQAQTTHTYSSGGTYEIKIRGIIRGWQFNNGGDRLKMGVIKNWGCLDISVNGGFNGCTNMTCVASDAPVISSTSLNSYFYFCSNFNGPIGNWNVSLVTSMVRMLEGAQKFNQNIGSWDVGNVTDMSIMFQGNGMSFNNGGSDSIKNWNVSKVTNFSAMFWRCPFNQPIGSWNVSSATNMSQMFLQNIFNQDIGSWDVSNVTNMSQMFRYNTVFNNGESESINNWRPNKCTNFSYMFSRARFNKPIGNWTFTGSGVNMEGMFYSDSGKGVFNQDIGSWNVSGVTNMSLMFRNTSFNNGGSNTINNWDVSNVINMSSMFQQSSFNQNIGSWNVSGVTNFSYMFVVSDFNNGGSDDIDNWTFSTTSNINMTGMLNACPFNRYIGSWNTESVTNMSLMFTNNGAFNQDISNWDTSNVVNMYRMFRNAKAFNQDISDWNISSVTNFTDFMLGKSAANYSATHLDNIYNKWSLQAVQPNLSILFSSIKYTAAGQAGKDILTGVPNNWTIVDGGT